MGAIAASRPEPVPIQERPARLWRNRTFVANWLGHAISVIGDGFSSIALGFWVLTTTGSSAAMGTIMTVRILTAILLGPLAGTFVDRTDRRRLMIAMDLVRIFLVGGAAVLIARPDASFGLILLLTALTAVAGQFFAPAFGASLVNIVGQEHVPQASGILQVTNTLGMVVGPFLGGTVVGLFGGPAALAIDAVSFLVSALLILAGGRFASPRQESGSRGSFWGDFREGLSFIRRHPLVRSVVTLSPLLNFFANAILAVLLPVVLVRVWHGSSALLGALEAAFPLGFAGGAMLYMAFRHKVKRRGYLVFGTLLGASVAMTATPLMPSVYAALALVAVTGALIAVPNVFFQATLQSEIPTEVQGRVMGTLNSLLSITAPVAFLLAGALGDLYDPVLVTVLAGVGLTLSVAAGFTASPYLRNYR